MFLAQRDQRGDRVAGVQAPGLARSVNPFQRDLTRSRRGGQRRAGRHRRKLARKTGLCLLPAETGRQQPNTEEEGQGRTQDKHFTFL
jgi:hypothetical protein